ncbi:MAG TPA: hypothetical protein VLE43_01815 [Candidatus Saccharimonadia bacterium]|nr:hypothetical protein [Candidatus Saccharimonadia bacterium]
MKTLTCLCLTTALCTLLTQCAVQPVEPLSPPTGLTFTDTKTHFDGKTYRRRETEALDGTGDSNVQLTEL